MRWWQKIAGETEVRFRRFNGGYVEGRTEKYMIERSCTWVGPVGRGTTYKVTYKNGVTESIPAKWVDE